MDYTKITWVDLMVTDRCNMNCRYCFHNQRPLDMSEDTILRAITFLRDKISDDPVFNFFGGEPMLRTEFCSKWLRTIGDMFRGARFHISTNGTIFDEGLIELFKRPGSQFQISYDGINQGTLRGNAEKVEKNIRRFTELLFPVNPSVRLTFTRDTVKDLSESMERCYSLGVRKFTHQPELNNDWVESDFQEYEIQLGKMYKFIKNHGDLYSQICDCSRIEVCRPGSVCAAGKTLISIDPVGNIYPCHRMVGVDRFKLGNVNDRLMHRGKMLSIKIRGCEQCSALPTCNPCIAANYEFNGALSSPINATCRINRIEYDMARKEYHSSYGEVSDDSKVIMSMISVLEEIKRSNDEILGTIG